MPTKKALPQQPTTSHQKRTEQEKTDQAPKASQSPFPITGIGASAGGLEALEEFFAAMPAASGIAFVVVTHLDPDHVSLLPELLARKTAMKVVQAEDGLKVAPNQVYVIPPNKEMALLNGSLQLLEISKPRGSRLLIDSFLRSLAQDQGHLAIGIILSGTGTDGSLGARAIKGEAGMVMAQARDSAKYDGMPQSVIATGLVDFILPPDRMPEQLLKYVRHLQKKEGPEPLADEENGRNYLQKIFVLLRAATSHDFSLYKKNTLYRRIERRMHVHQIDKLADYVRYLQNSDHELSILFQELLIGVTNFFRDPEAFELLKERYLPEILKNKPDDYQVRVWVPGCSTGEEAYTVAIIMAECMAEMGRYCAVQIFGTDLDKEAIHIARTGLYPESISEDVSQSRLSRFFTKKDARYQIKKNIREMVVFAPQNLIKDPPFTKLDLLCCRNLLIYFGPELQKKVLPIFHYSLKEDGILFLGSSESIGQASDLFSPINKKWKIFKRLPTERSAQSVLTLPRNRQIATIPENKSSDTSPKVGTDINTQKLLQTILTESALPPAVAIDDAANIIYVHGHTGRFLEAPEGEATTNLLEMARPGLKPVLATAIKRMVTERQEQMVPKVQIKENGDYLDINLLIRPLPDIQAGYRGMMLVIFEEITPQQDKRGSKSPRQAGQEKNEAIKKLEEELRFTKEDLQTTIDELETSNEELKSTNEELQSTNEELQSTNEELETSKEELQSLHEESTTVNAELQSRIDQLVQANDDIKNLLDATEIAILFLDIDFRIRRFTPKMKDIFPIDTTDIGRPISHFTSNLKEVNLNQYAATVLENLEKQEVEVMDNDGHIYRMRLRPYRTINNVIDGTVITLEDITELKKLLEKAERLATVVKDSNDAITLLDLEGNIIAWNRGAEKLYGFSEAEALTMNITEMIPPEKQNEALILTKSRGDQLPEEPLVTERLKKNGETVQVWLTATRLLDKQKKPAFIATTERDLSKIKKKALQNLTGEDNGKG